MDQLGQLCDKMRAQSLRAVLTALLVIVAGLAHNGHRTKKRPRECDQLASTVACEGELKGCGVDKVLGRQG